MKGDGIAMTMTPREFQTRLDAVRAILDATRPQLVAIANGNSGKIEAAALAWLSNYDRAAELLYRCTPESVVKAVHDFAAMGVAPDPVMEWGYFRAMGDTARAGLGYRGVIHLLAKDPNFHSVDVQCIYPGDTAADGGPVRVVMGTEPRVDHCVDLTAERGDGDNAGIIGVYGVIHFKAGPPKVEYMARAQVEQVRAESPEPMGDFWTRWWAAGARKSVIHRLRKYCHVDPAVAHVLAADELVDRAPVVAAVPVESGPAPLPEAVEKSKLDLLEDASGLYGAAKG